MPFPTTAVMTCQTSGGRVPSSECSHHMAGDGQVPHPKDVSMLRP